MPKGLQRIYGQGHLHFITCSCYRHLLLLGSTRAEYLREDFGRGARPLWICARRVRSHARTHPPAGERAPDRNSFPGHAGSEATNFARIAAPETQAGAGCAIQDSFRWSDDRLPQFWQRRFYDFNVWSRKKKIEKLQYMHFNPVKRGLAVHPKDWLWSSFAFCAKSGSILISMDGFLGSENQNPHR